MAQAGDWAEAWRLSFRVARRIVREPAEAEDIAQEAVLRAWRHRDRLQDPALFQAWLTRIVHREAARRSRSRRARLLLGEFAEEMLVDAEGLGPVEAAIDVSRAVAALNERERVLIKLRYEEDLTQPAIAARLGLPEGTVKVLLHRARNKLRGSLGEP